MTRTRSVQTRSQSAVEVCVSVAIGYVTAIIAQMVILPAWGVHVDASTHAGIAACFTAVSLVRSYIVRRVFEGRLSR